jgi:aspartyl-tRNA(Asn)/glutamyl-tRNA(Gln) amidotransferase subunit B
MEELKLPFSAASVLIRDRALSDYFEETVKAGAKPQLAANWVINELLRDLTANGTALRDASIRPAQLAALVSLVDQGALSNAQAKEVFAEMRDTGDAPAAIADRRGLRQSTDTSQLEAWCDTAIANDPKSVAQVKGGNPKAINALKGAVMKLSAGKANPRLVDEILTRKLG